MGSQKQRPSSGRSQERGLIPRVPHPYPRNKFRHRMYSKLVEDWHELAARDSNEAEQTPHTVITDVFLIRDAYLRSFGELGWSQSRLKAFEACDALLFAGHLHDSGHVGIHLAVDDVGAGAETPVEATAGISDQQRELEILRREHDRLLVEVENLKTRLAEECRRALRLEGYLSDSQKQVNGVLEAHNEVLAAHRDLRRMLEYKQEGDLRMFETYEGTVAEVVGDEVCVVFDMEDGVLEQVYTRDQFLSGRVPEPGESVVAHVFLATHANEGVEVAARTLADLSEEELVKPRKNVIKGAHYF